MESIWVKTTDRPQFSALERSTKTDVLIVGGGITGILAAYMLKRAGIDCILLEADRICGGITENTTAKITVQHGLHYDGMIRRFGIDQARLYLHTQQQALLQYRELCKTMDCNFETRDSYVYSLTSRAEMEREAAALVRLGCQASFTEQTELPFAVRGAVKVSEQAQFHPLKFLFALAKELPIYEHTKVRELLPNGVKTEHGTVQASKIIIATHFPILNKHGSYFLKLYQHRSYVIALKNVPDMNGMYVDAAMSGLSFRCFEDRLLLGGGGHRTGKHGGNWEEFSRVAHRYYPQATEVCRWATQDCMTLDSVPYIGQYSTRTPNLLVATGYNKWGMTASMTAARLLCDLVKEKKTDAETLFSPSRSILRPQLAVNAAESLIGLLTPTTPRCPHMGCALKYNKQEHTWDCPCHGSRFSETGELIDNPATDDRR